MTIQQLRELAHILQNGGSVSEYTQATAEFCRHAQELLNIIKYSKLYLESEEKYGDTDPALNNIRECLEFSLKKLDEV